MLGRLEYKIESSWVQQEGPEVVAEVEAEVEPGVEPGIKREQPRSSRMMVR